ncbi:hypothetical protein DV515_00006047 [Chloebia gouldiae]|uniref:Uncharacterized protein n=1 Tax=Chloebia gouldiae TaxID=44316 RepID=A0A3L8SLE5_CHLGU|nr:hypothetical protein DV515_00006047 [Chloebia gouldiae]
MVLTDENINHSKFVCCRTEAKVWSPLVSEEGKTHPYKMNLASEPQLPCFLNTCWKIRILEASITVKLNLAWLTHSEIQHAHVHVGSCDMFAT